MKMVDPTDDELSATFAEKVAGWRFIVMAGGDTWFCPPDQLEGYSGAKPGKSSDWNGRRVIGVSIRPMSNFTQSADAVLPWLEKEEHWNCEADRTKGGWYSSAITVTIGGYRYYHVDKSFPRAAVIALLRAHGVAVEFTK